MDSVGPLTLVYSQSTQINNYMVSASRLVGDIGQTSYSQSALFRSFTLKSLSLSARTGVTGP